MRQHVEGLEDEAHARAPQFGGGIVIEAGHGDAIDHDGRLARRGIRRIEAGDEIEQRRFADAGIAHDGDEFAGLEFHVRRSSTGRPL
jgi:hypothetical protein